MIRVLIIFAISLPLGASAQAQVVQLPTFRQFSTSTTVVVPDQGSVSLGGVGRAASGSNQFGAPGMRGNRPSSAAAQSGGISVSAQIHDFAEMDRRLLEQAAAMRSAASKTAARLPHDVHSQGVASILDIERANDKAGLALEEEARDLLQKAEDAYSSGKFGLARIYYRMAASREISPMRERALAGLARCNVSRQALKK